MSHELTDNQPSYFDNHGHPQVIRYGIEVTVIQDDVTTVAFLNNAKSGQYIDRGYARRHPLDARDPDIGHDLAVARAFANLADRYARKAERSINPDPDPMREPLRAMKRANRAEQKRRKNEKRREARERYVRLHGPNGMTGDEVRDALGRAFGDWS